MTPKIHTPNVAFLWFLKSYVEQCSIAFMSPELQCLTDNNISGIWFRYIIVAAINFGDLLIRKITRCEATVAMSRLAYQNLRQNLCVSRQPKIRFISLE